MSRACSRPAVAEGAPLLLLLAAACASVQAVPDEPAAPESPVSLSNLVFDDLQESATRPLFVSTAKSARVVFVGRLVEVGPSPGAWSGLVMATQALSFEVEQTLRGELSGRVTVHQILIEPSPLVQKDPPGLRARYTGLGQRYVVLLGEPAPDGRLLTASDTVGLSLATEPLLAELRAKLTP